MHFLLPYFAYIEESRKMIKTDVRVAVLSCEGSEIKTEQELPLSCSHVTYLCYMYSVVKIDLRTT